MNEAMAMALLVSTRGLGYKRRSLLLKGAGSARRVIEEPRAYEALLGEDTLRSLLLNIRDADKIRARLERNHMQLVVLGGEGYPPLLAQIAAPPHLLFVWGDSDLCDPRPFAIVGTRKASDYGLRHTSSIASALAQSGVCVVSGLALGIDAAAHSGALLGEGRTIAVIGSALDRFYPEANRPLMNRILESGGSVITEYPPGSPPTRYTFLERNRIIAGIGRGVLVTEAGLSSGALRTVHDALDEGREVFALPGSVDSALSDLPNQLISEGACLTRCASDIIEQLFTHSPEPAPRRTRPKRQERPDKRSRAASQRPAPAKAPQSAPKPSPALPGEREQAVLRALDQGEADFDALCERTGIPADQLSALLMMMEMDGYILSLPGLRYTRAK